MDYAKVREKSIFRIIMIQNDVVNDDLINKSRHMPFVFCFSLQEMNAFAATLVEDEIIRNSSNM